MSKNTENLYMLNINSFEMGEKKIPYVLQNTEDPENALIIYIKALNKISDLLRESGNYILEMQNASDEEGVAIKVKLTQTINEAVKIVDLFCKWFAITSDNPWDDMMDFFHQRFEFLKLHIDMLYLRKDLTYMKDCELVIKNIKDNFLYLKEKIALLG